jgi:hypothetical protein
MLSGDQAKALALKKPSRCNVPVSRSLSGVRMGHGSAISDILFFANRARWREHLRDLTCRANHRHEFIVAKYGPRRDTGRGFFRFHFPKSDGGRPAR